MRELNQTKISIQDYNRITNMLRYEFRIPDEDIITISVTEEKGRKVKLMNHEYYHINKYLTFRFPINPSTKLQPTSKLVKKYNLPNNIKLIAYYVQ